MPNTREKRLVLEGKPFFFYWLGHRSGGKSRHLGKFTSHAPYFLSLENDPRSTVTFITHKLGENDIKGMIFSIKHLGKSFDNTFEEENIKASNSLLCEALMFPCF